MMEPGTFGLTAQTCPSVSQRRVGGQRSERRRVSVQEERGGVSWEGVSWGGEGRGGVSWGGVGVRNRQVQLTWSSRSLASVSVNQP